MSLNYNTPGHVCSHTKRLALTIADAYAREDVCGRHFWTYYVEQERNNLDPWRKIDGIDPYAYTTLSDQPLQYALDFVNGNSLSYLQPGFVIYMQTEPSDLIEQSVNGPNTEPPNNEVDTLLYQAAAVALNQRDHNKAIQILELLSSQDQ